MSISSGGTETITFGSEKNTFGLYWGTIDLANTITFYDKGTLIASYTGSEVVGLLSANQGIFDSNGYIEFVGIHPFDRVVLDTGNTNAFEVENISAGLVRVNTPNLRRQSQERSVCMMPISATC